MQEMAEWMKRVQIDVGALLEIPLVVVFKTNNNTRSYTHISQNKH